VPPPGPYHDAVQPEQRRALDDLLQELSAGVMRPFAPHAHDHASWSAWGAGLFGRPWLEAPFLWSESYFYRRLLDATGFFGPGPCRWVDPFEYLNAAELGDPALEPDLAALDDVERLPAGEQRRAKLLASLWGNRADLGFRIGASRGQAVPGQPAADAWPARSPCTSSPGRTTSPTRSPRTS